MSIEEIAQAVAAEWQMGFDGIELDFALEVARRAVAAEREVCAKVCESLCENAERESGPEAAGWLDKAAEMMRSNV